MGDVSTEGAVSTWVDNNITNRILKQMPLESFIPLSGRTNRKLAPAPQARRNTCAGKTQTRLSSFDLDDCLSIQWLQTKKAMITNSSIYQTKSSGTLLLLGSVSLALSVLYCVVLCMMFPTSHYLSVGWCVGLTVRRCDRTRAKRHFQTKLFDSADRCPRQWYYLGRRAREFDGLSEWVQSQCVCLFVESTSGMNKIIRKPFTILSVSLSKGW